MLSELAKAVRDGEVSPRELVEASLKRIEGASSLNAVVALRAEEALADADASARTGPLAGLPLLVKDLARTKGMRTTFGSPIFADAPTDDVDDVVVARLKEAGAIVLGRTNSPAFGHTAVTVNQVFGATRNPWNEERSPGGSSGGSGAALAAGLAPLATTSDGGGSVRIPASCCGLVGYKPTNGAIGRNVIPRWMEFSTMGCTNATVADVLLEASVVLGPTAGDVLALPRQAISLTPRRPTKVVACRTLRHAVDPVIGAAFDDACATIERDLGIPVEQRETVTGIEAAADWFVCASADLAESMLPLRDHWDTFEDGLRFQVDFGSSVAIADYVAARRRRYEIARRVDDAIGDDGVLVTPTVNAQSWPAEGPLPSSAGGVTDPLVGFNTTDFNLTAQPAVNVPLGHDDAGVPFGLQIVASRCHDDLCLGLAEALEQVRPWALAAPGYEPFSLG